MGAVLRVFGPWWEGRYRCIYRREEGRWKFAAMHFRLVAPDRDIEADEAGELEARGEALLRGDSRAS
jgi:hypothetical protein